MTPTIERARRYVAKCPPAISGQGGHNATFRVACVLVHGFDLPDSDALMVMKEWNAGCMPPWSEMELIYKLKSGRAAVHSLAQGHLLGTPTSKRTGGAVNCGPERGAFLRSIKPTFCPMVLKRIAGKTDGIANVMEFIRLASPVPAESQDSASVLRRLYPPRTGEKVLIFSDMNSQGQFLWDANKGDTIQQHHLPIGVEGVWFLPQPVTGQFHVNPRLDGKLSRRSEEAVVSWRYAVLESDKAEPDDWLRCLIQLPLRVACVCESGGRSIHALVRIDAESKSAWDALIRQAMPTLVTLGADRGALSAVRLTRLPQARRGDRVQRLLYLNPSTDSTPIVRLGSAMEGSA